jgi:hypothetical protein
MRSLLARVMVVTAVSEVRGGRVEQDPKSYSSKRAVGLPGFLVDALGAHLADADMTTPVFTAQGGGPLRHGNFYNRVFRPPFRRRCPQSCIACGSTTFGTHARRC